MYKKVTINLDEACLPLFEQAAEKNGITVSTFLQNAGMLCLVRDDGTLPPVPAVPAAPQSPRTAKKKPKFTPQQTEDLFRDFVAELNQTLLRYRGETFSCRYSLSQENWFEWIPQELYSGESAEDNARMIGLLHDKLLRAIDDGDESRCFEVTRTAMDWGGVYYSRGVRKGNRAVVEKLWRDHELLPVLRRSRHHLEERELELLEYFSSGWSIIWYLLDRENLLIVSSRKVCALNRILYAFRRERKLEALPECLDFGQLVYQGSPRYIEDVRYVYTQKAKLILLKKFVRVLAALKELGDFTDNRELDNLFFILGE